MKKRVKRKRVAKKVVQAGDKCDDTCEVRILCWVPRILGILFTVFISLFALDSFGDGMSFGQQIIGFMTHLIPSIVLVAILIIAWKCEKLGGWLYIILGVVFTIFFNTYEELITFLIISGPLFVTGALFLISGMRNPKK